MKKVITTTLLIFSMSFCMAQNIKQAAEEQRQRELQQQQEAETQRQQEIERQQQAVEAQQRAQNSHSVIFNSDGGSAVAAQIIYNGEKAKKPANPTKANNTFVEWRREGTSTAFDFNTPITSSTTLKAVWVSLAPTVTVTSEGNVIRGATLAAKLEWLDRNAESHNTYIVEVSANENIAPRTLEYRGAINITVVLIGDGTNRTIRLVSNGDMFTVRPNVTFVLDNNVTLHGHSQNSGNMVSVNGGIFKMNAGTTITGNQGGGGVYVSSGTFEMNGGTISNNGKSTNFNGGGVDNRSIFTMNGGIISGNTASDGGGVYNSGTFTMNNGTISGNTANNGGGVEHRYGTFTMNAGTVSGNNANRGGGVYVEHWRNFTMRGGTITNNTAMEYGGGVYGDITKTGGTITGYNSDPDNGNVVRDNNGVLARRGHAVFVNENRRKERSSGTHVDLSNNNTENWEQ